MKKSIIISAILLFAHFFATAQTQQGYVKTKGRLASNGTVIKGQPISGAVVTVKGRTAVASSVNGTFSFPVPAKKFYLQSVNKAGYVLADQDILSKQYTYSENPFVVTLESPTTQADDKLAAERKIRRQLQRSLQQKEDEIEKLIEQNKISAEEYRKRLQEVYAQQEENEKLINQMAERYAKIDYDQIDDFQRQISVYILNGELTKADSLINSKGDINARITKLKQLRLANEAKEKTLNQEQEQLSKSKSYATIETEDLAECCFSKHEICKLRHDNDSAAYYIELRASLDTCNVDWQIDAGLFISYYMADYDKALYYYKA